MTLSQDDLTGAIEDGVKGADTCTRFCRTVASVEDGQYNLAHNGTGSRDTDSVRVHATKTLALGKDGLAKEVQAWVAGLHKGERKDLNALMATGDLYLVGERGPDLVFPTRGPAMTGWPWLWTDGSTP